MSKQKLSAYTPIRLPAELAAGVKRLAAKTGCTASEIHRRALTSFLAAAELATQPPTRRPPSPAKDSEP